MYEISDFAESPDVEYPAVPPKHSSSSLSQQNPSVARSTASYASLNYNGKVSFKVTDHGVTLGCYWCKGHTTPQKCLWVGRSAVNSDLTRDNSD